MGDNQILDEYRDVYQRFAGDGIIDMDKKLQHKFSYQILRLEDVVRQLHGNIPPNRQSLYYVILYKQASCDHSVGYFQFPIEGNTLVVIPQRVIHSILHRSLKCTGYLVCFSVDFFLNQAFPRQHVMTRRIFTSSLRPYLSVSPTQRKELENLFEYLLKESAETNLEKGQMIALKILELLILCDRFFSEARVIGQRPAFHPTIERFYTLIEEHFTQQHSVQFYANFLNVCPGHLNSLMKDTVGLNAKKAIDNRIFLEAKSLLAGTGDSVKEIAHSLGFADVNYFSSFFRKEDQQSPSQYREGLRTRRLLQ